jgi:competence protein ComEC
LEIGLILLFLLLTPSTLDESHFSRWIVWNVGQGEWVTHVLSDRCHHFDMGGEHWPKQEIRRACGQKRNFVYFSHWDLDHVGLVAKARGVLPNLCLGRAPIGDTSKRKMRLLSGLKTCPAEADLKIWVPPLARLNRKSSNEHSQIYIDQEKMLMTGDAPASEETLFVQQMGRQTKIHWLVLGHHGSRTSTSELLLQALPELKLAIASARHGKYGHPHVEILRRLRSYRIAVLTTEDWGNIEIEESP